MKRNKGLAIYLPREQCKSCDELREQLRIKDEINKLLRMDLEKATTRRCAVYSTAEKTGMPKMLGRLHMFRDNNGKTRMVVEDLDGCMHQVAPECVKMLDKVKS